MCVSIQQTEHLTRKQEKKGEKKKGQKTRNIRFLWQSKDRQRSPRGEMFLFCFLKTQTYKIKLYLHNNTKKYSWPLTTFIWSLFNMNSCDFTKNSSVQYSWFSYSYAFPVSLKLILGVFSQRLEFKDQSVQQEWQQLSGGCWKSTIRVELNERGQSETLHFILKSFLNFGHVGGGISESFASRGNHGNISNSTSRGGGGRICRNHGDGSRTFCRCLHCNGWLSRASGFSDLHGNESVGGAVLAQILASFLLVVLSADPSLRHCSRRVLQRPASCSMPGIQGRTRRHGHLWRSFRLASDDINTNQNIWKDQKV